MVDSPDPDAQEIEPTAEELEAAGQAAMFAAPAAAEGGAASSITPAVAPPADNQPYRVLARKYRPQTFSELIGQEPMVRTLANAIERDRLAHAFLMTGVRGVGKTSTARLIAKALNCIGPDGQGGPTIDPCGKCEPCVAIAEGRHMDVIEMDAASHTGVDDVREIIEAVRYSAVSARYKIYIIDEVHMLSRNAFNALLKTLEEPPAHVKFLFATTEVDKLPVTVLSRTQRFDLRRIHAEQLEQHFAMICEKEGVKAEAEALHMIAAASEGSVRDGLSILDQAIAHADLDKAHEDGGKVTAARVRNMLGLADKGAQRRLLGNILDGDAKALLAAIADQYALGVEPLALMRGLMDLVHRITVAQVSGAEPEAPTAEERAALQDWAGKLSAGQLHRLWQLLLKGYDEVRGAPDPLVSAQMALLRVLHAADLPDPGKLAKKLEQLGQGGAVLASSPSPTAQSEPSNERVSDQPPETAASTDPYPKWEEFIGWLEQRGHMQLGAKLRMQAFPVEVGSGILRYGLAQGFTDSLERELRDALGKLAAQNWVVSQDDGKQGLSLLEQEARAREIAAERIKSDPLVAATLSIFPGAEIVSDEPATTNEQAPPWSRNA
jgi:DNA polymerase-3 subunit gamma/tau